MDSQVPASSFFDALYKGIGGGFIEIRPLLDSSDPRKKSDEGRRLEAEARKFFAVEKQGPEKAAAYCMALSGFHVYFGVGLRAKPGSGGKDNIGCVPCAFADVDFKHIPKEAAIERLKKLPFKPSIIVLSGNGVHVYWLFDYPVFQSKLPILEELNRSLLKACGAQVGTQDSSRILRVPQTANIKAEYPDPKPLSQVVRFDPSCRHGFEAMVAHFRIPPPSAPPSEASPASGGGVPSPAPTPPPPPGGETVDVQALPVNDSTKRIIREGLPAYIQYRKETDPPGKFEERQRENQLSRSEADAHVVSQLLAAGLTDPQIYAVFRDEKNHIGEKYRERRDGDKYLGVTIQKMKAFRADHPRTSPGTAAERVGRSVDHRFRDHDFEVTKIVKIDYQSPIYLVTTAVPATGECCTTKCTDEELDSFVKFRKRHLIQQNKFPPPLKQPAWESLVNGAQFEVQKVEEEIATVDAEINEALDEWLSQAQPEVTEASIQYFPAIDHEVEKTYLKVKAFMAFLANEKIEVKKRDVIHVVKGRGFKLECKRMGKGVQKLWARPSLNGQLHPTPKAPPPPPAAVTPPAAEPPQEELFQ